MRGGAIRKEIPLNLDDRFRAEALTLRNQLLLYRLRNFGAVRSLDRADDRGLEPRLEQIFGPLLSVVEDQSAVSRITRVLGKLNEDLTDERSETAEAQVLMVIREIVARGPDSRLAIQDIASEFTARYGEEYERRVTPRWIGSLVRRRLGLKPNRSTGVFTLGPEEVAKLGALYARYGIEAEETQAVEPVPSDAA